MLIYDFDEKLRYTVNTSSKNQNGSLKILFLVLVSEFEKPAQKV